MFLMQFPDHSRFTFSHSMLLLGFLLEKSYFHGRVGDERPLNDILRRDEDG